MILEFNRPKFQERDNEIIISKCLKFKDILKIFQQILNYITDRGDALFLEFPKRVRFKNPQLSRSEQD